MMSDILTPDSLKQKAKTVRKFLSEQCGIDISHGKCLELCSQLFGFKDWNTASALTKPIKKKSHQTFLPKTVGAMRKVLGEYPDSAKIEAVSFLDIDAFGTMMAELNVDFNCELETRYSLILGEANSDSVQFVLKAEGDKIYKIDRSVPQAVFSKDDILEV